MMSSRDYEQGSVDILVHVLADTYVLAIKTQNAHWNLRDPGFIGMHELLDEQYQGLQKAIDVLAERIKALGGRAPGSMKEFMSLSRLTESSEITTLKDTVLLLSEGHKQISSLMLDHIKTMSGQGDEGTIDLLVERIRDHDHQAWLLEAHDQS